MTITRPLVTDPGYEVTQPGGTRAWLAEDGVVITEDLDAGVYRVNVPDLPEPVVIDADEVIRAAAGLPNLIAARVHDARVANADVCPWHPASPEQADDEVDQAVAALVAAALHLTHTEPEPLRWEGDQA